MLSALALAVAFQTTPPSVPATPKSVEPSTPVRSTRAIESAFTILDRLRKESYSSSSHFYGEEWELGRKPGGIAFNWSIGVLLSALASAAKTDPNVKTQLLELAYATSAYWNDEGPTPGYDVLPGPKSKDRYYDDNAWMVMALLEAYDATKKVDFLVRARDAYAFVISGESKDAGGGIFWRESDKASKNACVAGPAAYGALGLYERTKDKRYLADAVRLYRWTDATLRDPADGLIWDNISTDGTKIEKTKWSYNTALMLKTEAKLLELNAMPGLTKTVLLQHAEAAVARWTLPSGGFRDEAQFAHMLFEALILIDPPSYGPEQAKRTLRFLRDESIDRAGHYGPRWEAKSEGPVLKPKLIHQASAMRAFAFAAEHGINP